MRIHLVLEVDAQEFVDENSPSGITDEAHEKLHTVLPDEGFLIVSGPTKVRS